MRKTNKQKPKTEYTRRRTKRRAATSTLRDHRTIRIPSHFFKKVSVRKSSLGGLGLFTEEKVRSGEPVLRLGGRLIRRRTRADRNTLRLGRRLFLTGSGDLDDYINHSCVPNCRIEFHRLLLVALRDIGKGEELTFNYCTTEYVIDPPFRFTCRCGYERCPGTVSGYRHLAASERRRLRSILSPFLKEIA